ncbi:MAG: hypothetical protein K2X77_24420 [Candidatus Obscuribacterales bacterium]|jgi:hypothetical protein|nr:hypothetical protein [Candidatus Obscuribacterales bacterium]
MNRFEWLLSSMCLSLLLTSTAYAQTEPGRSRVAQRWQESQQFLSRGDYSMAANRMSEASSLLRSAPNAMPGQTPVSLLRKGLDDFAVLMKAQQNNKAQYNKILIAQEPIINALCMYEPQNPRWFFQRAMVFVTRAGGSSASGTAGDRHYIVQAIRDLDKTLSCPSNAEYVVPAQKLKAMCQTELDRRKALGTEIQRRGARQFAKIYGMPGGSSQNDFGPTLCTICGQSHRSGECTYRRD